MPAWSDSRKLYQSTAGAAAGKQQRALQAVTSRELRRIYARLERDLPRKLARYYEQDPTVAALHEASSTLEALPRHCAKRLHLAFDRPTTRGHPSGRQPAAAQPPNG